MFPVLKRRVQANVKVADPEKEILTKQIAILKLSGATFTKKSNL